MQIDVADEERDILIRWKKRSDTYRLMKIKAEAIVYAARGVGLDIIAEMVYYTGMCCNVNDYLKFFRDPGV